MGRYALLCIATGAISGCGNSEGSEDSSSGGRKAVRGGAANTEVASNNSSGSGGASDGGSTNAGVKNTAGSTATVIAIRGTMTDPRDGTVYATTTLGSQTWMAENLKYAGPIEETVGICNQFRDENCAQFGRLYNWVTAMVLKPEDDTGQWQGHLPHQGLCPNGWHIPSEADWQTLFDAIWQQSRPTTAMKLKSSHGWINKPGTDDFGFAMVPGGDADEYEYFGTPGYYGSFWLASETADGKAKTIDFDETSVLESETDRRRWFNIRCVQNAASDTLDPNAATAQDLASADFPWNSAIQYGSLTDSRDGRTYRTVEISAHRWMAENLAFAGTVDIATTGLCVNNNPAACAIFGRLYSWTEAMQISESYQLNHYTATLPYRGICPSGWHLPSTAEWNALITAADANGPPASTEKLRAAAGWTQGSGTDDYGFRSFPTGIWGSFERQFWLFGSKGIFWTSSESLTTLHASMYGAVGAVSPDLPTITDELKRNSAPVRCTED